MVELLESILALIREARSNNDSPVVLVLVVGDRKWIKESLDAMHRGPRYGAGPGRSTAEVRFGEIFDLDVTVPSATDQLQRDYLADILDSSGLPESRKDYEARIRAATSEKELLRLVHEASLFYSADLVSKAAAEFTSPEEQARTAHPLERFIPLLPPSPREMKRFVNQVGMLPAVQFMEERVVSLEVSARWVILGLRWPGMRDFLSSAPRAS